MINKDLYSNKKEMLKMIEDCEDLSDIQIEEDYIFAYDNREGMDLYFHYINGINYNELFNFGSLNVDKNKFYKILNENIDNLLFLMPRKIFFISSDEELENLLNNEDYVDSEFDIENYLGQNWSCHSTIIINVKLSRELSKEKNNFGESSKIVLNEIIWTTLIHELRHMVCDLGLIVSEELIPISDGSEDTVEEYGRNVFWNNIIYHDYLCFN